MQKETCELCDAETGRAGRHDDSLFLWDKQLRREVGPLCEICHADCTMTMDDRYEERSR